MTGSIAAEGVVGAAPCDVQAAWAHRLLAGLVQAGIRHAVLAPGSRSTPFVLAAHRHPDLECHDVVDERAAGFFALGLGRVTGFPALVITTSGTAVANLLPAVVEAGMAQVPLVVLTADRPVELVACGANQTIDQLKIFGDHARAFFDLGVADPAPEAARMLGRVAAQAVHTSRGPAAGAVHLNARARKPLEPGTDVDLPELPGIGNGVAPIVYPPRAMPDPAAVEALASRIREEAHGLVVAGPGPIAQGALAPLVAALGRVAGYPLIADAASQLRFAEDVDPEHRDRWLGQRIDGADALLRVPAIRSRLRPTLVLQVGRAPISGAWKAFLASYETPVERWVIGDRGWQDPSGDAHAMLLAEPGATLDALVAALTAEPPARDQPTDWQRAWQRADSHARREADALLADVPALGEAQVARTAVSALPEGGLLALGNSLPIRQVDTWVRGAGQGIGVWSQRGASGIDGVVSGVAGAATAWGRPTLLLIGDVSFLHDLSGLGAATPCQVPFVVLVVQNRGGRIFEQLPIATHPAAEGALDHWLTPHDADLGAAAAVHGFPFVRCRDQEALGRALAQAIVHPGCSIVEAVVPPHGAQVQNRVLQASVARAFEDDG